MMLRIFIQVLFIVFLVKHANAQETATKNRKYKTWIKKTDKTRLIGRLYDVEDTKLRISNSFKAESSQFNYIDVYAYEIEKIKLRRKGSIGRGILFGVAFGLVTGAIIGKFVDTDDSPCSPPPPFVPSTIFSGINSILGLYGLGIGADDYRNIYMRQQYLYYICEASWQPGEEKALQYGFMGGAGWRYRWCLTWFDKD